MHSGCLCEACVQARDQLKGITTAPPSGMPHKLDELFAAIRTATIWLISPGVQVMPSKELWAACHRINARAAELNAAVQSHCLRAVLAERVKPEPAEKLSGGLENGER